MSESKHPAWERHLEGIGDELLHLTIACNVSLRDPGVIDRILRNDDTVCGTSNPIGFRKLRSLLLALFSSLNKAVDRLGPEDTREITAAIIKRLDERRALAGIPGSRSPASS